MDNLSIYTVTRRGTPAVLQMLFAPVTTARDAGRITDPRYKTAQGAGLHFRSAKRRKAPCCVLPDVR